jgi:hypothetical protein
VTPHTTFYTHTRAQLLDEGADIHAIAPKRQTGGSALAEAVAGRHEALVELLLRYGADPFTENPGGKTPLDLALEARAVNIVRACERQALFAGYVGTRVSHKPPTTGSVSAQTGAVFCAGQRFPARPRIQAAIYALPAMQLFVPSFPLSPLSALQVGQLKGFSYTSKDRWVVIAPRFTPPPPGGSVGEVRVMMLLFRNAAEADPRTKVSHPAA